jgi:radical SAM protein with 4Fe4S-binding SPASM domain
MREWPGIAESLAPPDHLYIELTDRCNLRCKHCYLSAGAGGQLTLDPELVRTILVDFVAIGGYSVAFSGGEPLLVSGWTSIVANSRSLGLATTVVTNGTLLDERAIFTLLDQGVTIAISLEGQQASTHDSIRGRGSFARVRKALDKFVALGAQANVVICFTPTRRNLAELPALAAMLAAEGFRSIYISLLEERGRERSNAPELSLTLGDKVQLLKQLAELLLQEDMEVDVETGHLRYFFTRILQGWDGLGDPMEGTLRVTSGGQVFLTAYVDDERFLLGRLPDVSLRQCWSSERVRQLFAEADQRMTGLPACQECPYWIVCGAGSPARAYAKHGDLMEPDDFCEAKSLFLEDWFGVSNIKSVKNPERAKLDLWRSSWSQRSEFLLRPPPPAVQ